MIRKWSVVRRAIRSRRTSRLEVCEPRRLLAGLPPEAVNDVYELEEDTSFFAVSANIGVLANDSDPEDNSLKAELVRSTRHGTLGFNANGSFLYVPDEDFFGEDTFTYRPLDPQAGNVATVTLNVTPVDDIPEPVDDEYRSTPGNVFRLPGFIGILVNDQNPDNVNMTAVLDSDVEHGQLTLGSDGGFEFDPQGFGGVARFTYRIEVENGEQSRPGTVTIHVTSPPVANADVLTVSEDTPTRLDVLANDVDAENDPLVITIVDDVVEGLLSLNADGEIYYEPPLDFVGSDEFSYFVSDRFEDSETVSVTINVEPVNDAPIAVADGYFVLPAETLVVSSEGGILVNDVDIDGPSLTASLVTPPSSGVLELRGDGSFVYTPHDGFIGTDTFRYAVSDGDSQSQEVVHIGVVEHALEISEFMTITLDDTHETRMRTSVDRRYVGVRSTPDWIEIHNRLDFPIDLGGMHLTDDVDEPKMWEIPPGTKVDAQSYLLIYASGADLRDTNLDQSGRFHTNFQLSDAGEYLALTASDGTVLHAYDEYPRQLLEVSYGITESGPGYLLQATGGLPNETDAVFGITTGPTIDTDGGFFDEEVVVSMTNHDPLAVVRYTLDGSEPTTENGFAYEGPFPLSATTVVRARAFRENLFASRTDTRSYIFLSDVIHQSPDGQPPDGWPETWTTAKTDYGMDPEIVNDEIWGPQLEAALTQIPSMSIVTSMPNLFDRRSGIYSRPHLDGFVAERPSSLELIRPDGTQAFQHNIGLRIRGGYSRSEANPKHAFRLFFDTVHGDGRLDFPLFPDDPTAATSFAKIDLRTSQNYSWAFAGDGRNTFMRDVYARDLQLAMGQQSTRGNFYHLYINGMYFGIYQTDERPSADFGESYYGGNANDYDVVHNDPRSNAATDGTKDAYERLFDFFDQENGLSNQNMDDYYKAQGMNPDGTRNPEYERLLDVDNLIDYMIITYYTADADGPGSKFTRPGLNNIFVIYNRENPDGFKYIEHDSEHSLDTGDGASTGYNMVSPLVRNGAVFSRFNPHWMHEQLANSNSDYLTRFRDRVEEVFGDSGVLSADNYVAMIERRAAEIDLAIIAESARWGDSRRANNPFTKDDWVKAVEVTKAFPERRGDFTMPRRAQVKQQLAAEGWWFFDALRPQLSVDGGQVARGQEVTVTAVGNGSTYVTTDGSDPRLSGGLINPAAQLLQSGDSITVDATTRVLARYRYGVRWSTITDATFYMEAPADATSLHISELHYNPAAPSPAETAAGFDDKDDFEFLEFVNVSETPIDLTGTRLEQVIVDGRKQGLVYEFALGTTLSPGERLVLAEDVEAFRTRYGEGIAVAGQWSGGLNNASEMITVRFADETFYRFRYQDDWYSATDAGGASLELADVALPPDRWQRARAWFPSPEDGGSPGRAAGIVGDVNGDQVFNDQDLVHVFQAGEYEDGVEGNSTYGEGDWNRDGEFDSEDIVFVFTLGRYQTTAAAIESADAALAGWSDEL